MRERETEILVLKTESGHEFMIEASSSGGQEDVAGFGDLKSKDLVESITALSDTFATALKAISPDKFSVEFGVEVTLKAGKLLALLCNGEGKANLKITLEWSKKE